MSILLFRIVHITVWYSILTNKFVTISDYHWIPPALCLSRNLSILTLSVIALLMKCCLDNEGPCLRHGIWIFAACSTLRFTCCLHLIPAAATRTHKSEVSSLENWLLTCNVGTPPGCFKLRSKRWEENNEIGSDVEVQNGKWQSCSSILQIATKSLELFQFNLQLTEFRPHTHLRTQKDKELCSRAAAH